MTFKVAVIYFRCVRGKVFCVGHEVTTVHEGMRRVARFHMPYTETCDVCAVCTGDL